MFHIYKKRAWMKWLRVFNAVVILSLALQPVSPALVLAEGADESAEVEKVVEETPEEPAEEEEIAEEPAKERVDLSEYENVLKAVDEDDYTKDSWEAYQKIVQENEVGEDNRQDEVNDATEAIEKAQKDLVKKADLSEYEDVLEAVDEEDYTEDSWAAYMQVVEANVVDENDSQDAVDEATQNIRDAQKDLVEDTEEIPNGPTVEAAGEASTERKSSDEASPQSAKAGEASPQSAKAGEASPEPSDAGENTAEEVSEEDQALAKWIADARDDGYEIVEVAEDETYEYGDDGFSITFTGIDNDVAEAYRVIGIKEVTLTEEQQEALGALSETAYDVISPMENGDFEYELTLPTPEDVDEGSVAVAYVEEEDDLDKPEKVETVNEEDVSVDTDKQETKVKTLDHFTIFVVTSSDADYVGNWIHYSSQGYEDGGVDYPTTIPSGQTATWNFSSLSPTPADYDVYISWSTHENRTTSAPYTLNHNGGTDDFSINQEQLADQSTNGGSGEWSGWYYLGKYSLDSDSNLVLESVDNSSGSDYVIADTVAIVDDSDPLNVWVDDDYTQFGVNDYHIWGYNAFSTIQEGIDAAGEGGTVHVAAGTYEENIDIDKTLTLIGAQAGVDPRPSQGGRSGGESIIKSSSTAVTIDADNVIFNGFTVESHVTSSSYNVVEAVDVGFPTVIYNIVHNVDPGASSNEGIKIRRSGGSGALVSYNYVYDIPSPGDAIGFDTVDYGEISYNEIRNIGSSNAAVYVYGSSKTLIKENFVDTTTQNDGIKLGSKNGDDAYKTGGIIEKNVVENTAQDGISVYMSNTRVEDNDISVSNSENGALYLAFYISNVEILGNDIHDNSLSTSKRTDAGAVTLHGDVYADSVKVNNNLIYGNTPYQLTNLSADELDATLNWWGSAEFSDIAPKISGEVDYNPWCLDEDCTETTKDVYSKTKIKTLSSRGQNVNVGGLRIKNITGSGELFVAKYDGEPKSGGFGMGVDGFYYDIQYSGTIDFPVKVVIKYSDNPSKSNYLDESKFTSLYYYDEVSDAWKDYRLDDPASSVEIDTAKNKITAHLEHFTSIVVGADTTAPTVPVLTWPIGGVATSDNSPLMQWEDSTDDSGIAGYYYRVYYHCSDEGNVPASCTSLWPNEDGKERPVSEYQAGTTNDGTYFWQVRAEDNFGNLSDWSDPEKVIIDTQTPNQVSITTPSNGDYFTSSPIPNEWTAVSDNGDSGVATYRVWYAYDDDHGFGGSTCGVLNIGGKDGRCRDVAAPGTSRNHTPGTGEQGGVTIRVQAIDNAGNEGVWSDPVHYYYDEESPVITLNGDADVTVAQGSTYIDNGATATDNVDGDITADIVTVNSVDTNILGIYTVTYDVSDSAGNAATQVIRTVHVTDQTAPVVTIESPAADAYLRGLVDITGSVTDNVELSHYNLSLYPGDTDLSDGDTHSGDRLNDGRWCTSPVSGTVYGGADVTGDLCTDWDTSAYDDGEYQIRLAARDAAGNRDTSDPYNGGTSSVHVIGITLDNTAPMATIDGEAPKATYNGNTDIKVHAIDDNYSRTELYRSGEASPFKTYTGAWFGLWWLPDNDYRMVVIDEAGNSTEYTFMVDRTDPVITFEEPVTGSVHAGDIHLRATCDEECDYVNFWWRAESESFDSASKRYHYVHDNGTVFEWDLNSLAAEKADGSTYVMSDGTYYLYAAGRDVVGNWARTAGEVEIVIDNTAPESTIDGGENGSRVYTNEWDGSISGTASDNLSGVNRVELSIMRKSDGAYYDGVSWVAGEIFVTAVGTDIWTYTLASPAEDAYTVVSHAVDVAGNREDTYTLTMM